MNLYDERSRVIRGIVLFVGLIFLLRLVYIQIIDKDYKVFAENNALRKEVIFPARGLIYDRHGKILVRNTTVYDVMVTPSQVKELDTNTICRLLEVDKAEFMEAYNKAKKYSPYKASPIVRQINAAQYGRFQERLFAFPGFFMQPRTIRSYPLGVACHAIGYQGEVDSIDMKKSDYYKLGDYIGQSGLEKSYEEQLRGKKGIRHVLVDVLNREQGHYQNGKYDVPSVAGKDLMTGLDLKLQQYAEKLMKGKLGAVVAIEPKTGEILTMLSSPGYDPNLLLGRDRRKNFPRLILDPDKPMFNRAVSAIYPPGSTLKPFQALMALQQHVIRPSTTFTCNGGYQIGSHTIGCHSRGTFDVFDAIRLSCNTYYCNVFRELIDGPQFKTPAHGLDNWHEWLEKFGIGKKTGIDIPNESKGFVPTQKYYNKYHGEGHWRASTIMSLAIGQAEISLTPLQLANGVATIANRGYYITPHFVRAITDKQHTEELKWERHETGIDTAYLNLLANAMNAVVERGTGTMARVKGIAICGKTGTAQNPHGEDHSLFICFAPKDTPKIAICIMVENAGYGGSWAAPIGGLLIDYYLNDSISRKNVEQYVLDARYLKVNQEKKKQEEEEEKRTGKKPPPKEVPVPNADPEKPPMEPNTSKKDSI
jgi:penicillin-binding protein 2